MENEERQILVLGAGIGGLSAAFELLKAGKKVTLIEKDSVAGGLAKGLKFGAYHVDLGYKQFYNRIPQVNSFFDEVLENGIVPYNYRIGIYYNNRIFEREKRFKGILRGMQISDLLDGAMSLVFQKLRYWFREKKTIEDVSWSGKGEFFSILFSQGFDEKLKGRPWSSVPKDQDSSDIFTWEKHLPFNKLLKEIQKGESKQKEWFHPLKGSGGLMETLQKKIIEMGGEIIFNTKIFSVQRNQNQIQSIEIESKGELKSIQTSHLISSIRLEVLASFLGIEQDLVATDLSFFRAVIIIYLFFDGPSKFPHTCLQVSDPKLKIGRVTNYEAFNCGMVPPGKSCLAFEIFCKNGESILDCSDLQLLAIVKDEFRNSSLIDWTMLENTEVVKLPLGDAANASEDYRQGARKKMYDDLCTLENLYNVNRNGIDKTIYTSIRAAESILKNDRIHFLKSTSPAEDEPWKIPV